MAKLHIFSPRPINGKNIGWLSIDGGAELALRWNDGHYYGDVTPGPHAIRFYTESPMQRRNSPPVNISMNVLSPDRTYSERKSFEYIITFREGQVLDLFVNPDPIVNIQDRMVNQLEFERTLTGAKIAKNKGSGNLLPIILGAAGGFVVILGLLVGIILFSIGSEVNKKEETTVTTTETTTEKKAEITTAPPTTQKERELPPVPVFPGNPTPTAKRIHTYGTVIASTNLKLRNTPYAFDNTNRVMRTDNGYKNWDGDQYVNPVRGDRFEIFQYVDTNIAGDSQWFYVEIVHKGVKYQGYLTAKSNLVSCDEPNLLY